MANDSSGRRFCEETSSFVNYVESRVSVAMALNIEQIFWETGKTENISFNTFPNEW